MQVAEVASPPMRSEGTQGVLAVLVEAVQVAHILVALVRYQVRRILVVVVVVALTLDKSVQAVQE